jgi:hypothetical protein
MDDYKLEHQYRKEFLKATRSREMHSGGATMKIHCLNTPITTRYPRCNLEGEAKINRKSSSLRNRAAWLAAALLALLIAPLAVAQQGGGQGAPPGGDSESGSHEQYIQFDEETGEYVLTDGDVQFKRLPAADAERSLSTELCGECHENAIAQLKNSVHFSVQSGNPRILFPGGGAHGSLDRACGLPGTSALINYTSNVNLGECGKCHVGRFIPPMQNAFTSSFTQMFLNFDLSPEEASALASSNAERIVDGGLDCLICHADHYLSVRDDIDWSLDTLEIAGYAEPGEHSPSPQGYGKLSRDNTDFDHDGIPDDLIDTDGDGKPDMPLMLDLDGDGVPETPWPTLVQDRSVEAVLSVGRTDEHHCLRCHEHARTGYKRGTLFRVGYDAHANVCFPDPRLTADNPNCPEHNTCTACHVTLDYDHDGDGLLDVHKFVRGHLVGGDMAAADYPPPPPGDPADPADPTHLTCVQCHNPDQLPQRSADGVHSETHLEKIACETCHITRSGGITYSMYGHGGHISFGRNTEGQDTKLITLDHMVADEGSTDDIDADFEAFRLTPVLMWFDGSTSFLAQSMAVRSSPNAKIVPFKPMANGMLMDGRYFKGEKLTNEANFDYNAYSMYRFYANAEDCNNLQLPGMEPFVCSEDGKYGNAEVFTALGLLGTVEDNFGNIIIQGQTPEDVRKTTVIDLLAMDRPDMQTMAMMQVFPNLMNFSKTAYGYEHYLVSSVLAGTAADTDGNGVIDEAAPYLFKMYDDDPRNPGAVNAGLMEFKGFNQPMYLPSSYDWYPLFESISDGATMKLPDGKFMKLFLGMKILMGVLPVDTTEQTLNEVIAQLTGNYPAFSNGVTLGGHGIVPNPQQNALGSGGRFGGCQQCHVEGGVLESKVPVSKEQEVPTLFGMLRGMPVYKWKYYNISELINLGLTTSNEDVVAGDADIDIDGNATFVRESAREMVLNWFQPGTCAEDGEIDGSEPVECFLPADSDAALAGTGLDGDDLTWATETCEAACVIPEWMPVLEPVTSPVPNYAVLGYARDEVIWDEDDPRINPGPPDGGDEVPVIEEAEWQPKNAKVGKLEVEGSAAARDRIQIVNGVTSDLLFSLSAAKDGSFEVERRVKVTKAPCTVAAKVNDMVGEAVAVENIPQDCVGTP